MLINPLDIFPETFFHSYWHSCGCWAGGWEMKVLPWYFGNPSEVRLTQASCCDGLHYGVYGPWGSAPTSLMRLEGKRMSPTGSPHARLLGSSFAVQTQSATNCSSCWIHEHFLENEKGTNTKRAWTIYWVENGPWPDPAAVASARPLLSAGHERSGCPRRPPPALLESGAFIVAVLF